MFNNLKPKIIASLILALLILQPISLIFASVTTYTYDQNGNILTETTEGQSAKYYTWDYKDQLIKSVVNGITTTYAYDHTGQRIKQTTGEVTTIYPSKYYSIDSNGKATDYIYANDQLVATVEKVGTTVTPYYVHTDHLGSIDVVTDKTGAIVEKTDYYPYGSVRLDQKTGSTDSTGSPQAGSPQAASFSGQRKYIGQEYDELTKLNYLNARYYDSKRGQFLSQDPVFWEIGQTNDGKKALLNPQSQNSYSYANGNPITNSDPNGRWLDTVIDAGFIGYDLLHLGKMWHSGQDTTSARKALGLDILGAALPGVAGLSVMGHLDDVSKAEKALNKAVDATRATQKDKILYRLGEGAESASRLERKASEAEIKIGTHGVSASTTKPSSNIPCSSVSCSALESQGFKVHETGTRNDPGHHTIELPKPVTNEVAKIFNKIFGRE